MLDGFDMKDITTCESLMVGDVLSWKDAKFAMNGDSREVIPCLYRRNGLWGYLLCRNWVGIVYVEIRFYISTW